MRACPKPAGRRAWRRHGCSGLNSIVRARTRGSLSISSWSRGPIWTCAADLVLWDARAIDPSSGFKHLTLSTDAIIKAAEFWAFLRQSGNPTASPDALDSDPILAGQAALADQPADTVTSAMTNLAHCALEPFPRYGRPDIGIRSGRPLAQRGGRARGRAEGEGDVARGPRHGVKSLHPGFSRPLMGMPDRPDEREAHERQVIE